MFRTLLTTSAAALLVTACATAPSFDTDLAAATGPIKLEVVPSEDLAYRANNEPRTPDGIRRSAFGQGGHLGDDAIAYLVEETTEELVRDLGKAGVALDDDAPTVLRVVIEDARNNRPTFRQLAQEPSLDFNSFGVGGAEFSAALLDADGATLGAFDYEWYDTLTGSNIDQGNGVWTDANRAISRFSRRTAESLATTIGRAG